jgi:hypothetical protein
MHYVAISIQNTGFTSRNWLKTIPFLFLLLAGYAPATAQKDTTAAEALPDYDILFNDLKSFLDSLTAPRTFATVTISASRGAFQYETSPTSMQEKERWLLTPTAGYYHKIGLGANIAGSLISDGGTLNLYQTAVTASYDYLKNWKLLTGVAYTRFFTKDKLPFYTSPLSNEINAYMTYRGWWLRPALSAVYGWGSTSSVEKQAQRIKNIKKEKKVNGRGNPRRPEPGGQGDSTTTIIELNESITDISLAASVKHDFYWRNVVSKKDYFRLTPQLALTGGTQRFGLAQTISSSYTSEKHSSTVNFYNTQKNLISVHSAFQLLALSARIRTEFSKGIWFVQPQLFFDYYFPETERKVEPSVVLNAGILF